MTTVEIENQYGQKINLSNNASYIVTSITGLTPAAAVVNTSTLATMDGSEFNSSRIGNRNIVLTILPRGSVEAARIDLYKYMKPKHKSRIWLKNGTRDVFIDGVVETMEGDPWNIKEQIQPSFICPNPYFQDKTERSTSITSTAVDVNNPSEAECGCVIEITAQGAIAAENPVRVIDDTTGEWFGFHYALAHGDKVTINTKRGEKSITLLHNGTTTNLINYIMANSKWLQLRSGVNSIKTSSEGSISTVLKLRPIYQGV